MALPKVQSPLVAPLLQKAAEKEALQHFKAAAFIYKQVLDIDGEHKDCLTSCIRLLLKVGRNKEALELSDRAAALYPEDFSQLYLHAICLRDCGRFEEALDELDHAAQVGKQTGDKTFDEDSLKVCKARTLARCGGPYAHAAALLISEVLQANPNQDGALLEYVLIVLQRGLAADATRILLRLLVNNHGNARVRDLFGQCLREEGMVELVCSEVGDTATATSALAFLAAIARDHGAVNQSLILFRRAAESAPGVPTHALAYMHALEIVQRYSQVLAVAVALLQQTKVEIPDLAYEPVIEILAGLPEQHAPLRWAEADGWQGVIACASPDTKGSAANGSSGMREHPSSQVEYSPAQLDVLAILFTCIKVLYVGGAIGRTYQLIQAVEPARRASVKPLHTTMIRNEAAYHGCVLQLLRAQPPPSPLTAPSQHAIYLCGDSHCLPGGWQRLSVGGRDVVVVPNLVTGCKIWHLREKGSFYPKTAWANTVASLPHGAWVIFMFGEIDCREGLLLAVDKLKYADIQEAMGVLADIYMEVLTRTVRDRDRDLRIFVHPVPPVLNETRHIVTPFNDLMRQRVKQAESQNDRLRWLDVADRYLCENRSKLNPKLNFDGTHMSPAFLQYVNAALEDMNIACGQASI
ncbi:TPR-like protein [Coccomyxa subellipsoidea C-169]|uniref:TPR-like protein n=1 Tax=Coccomyxa subellipsoidea (strain C-169) TaxID=574566 RepID=I0YMY6_COCSC|nr:TPR-like protein [Coccomyxa subellipsoidea C-169]EIE19755.1 TPR-like protein [Coccomyxa subellipsoidea C-169]|eukprot:XP_005644299.1 TPR-like protein [Coccomyxa subellipsoidea C-169]